MPIQLEHHAGKRSDGWLLVTRKLVVALVMAGCTDEPDPDPYCGNGRPDPYEECEPGWSRCTDDCALIPIELIAHWSFETLNGDSKAPCLPGDPPVQIQISSVAPGYGANVSVPCSAGQAAVLVKETYVSSLSIASGVNRKYVSKPLAPGPISGRDLPTVVVYTDAGYIRASARYTDTAGQNFCRPPTATTVRFVVDGLPDRMLSCATYDLIGPFAEGPHTLLAEGLDADGNVVATSSPIDVYVIGGVITKDITIVFPVAAIGGGEVQ